MKKHLLVLLSLLLAVMTVQAERISQEDAALVANNFMNVASATGVKKSVQPMKLKKAASATENQYYVYENANGKGWVMVAANDVAHPILAYSETGQFRTDNQPANLKVWLNGYNKQIKRAEQDGLVAPESIQQEWKNLRKGARKAQAIEVVAPLIKTGWDQTAPFWNLCPQEGSKYCYTGCVATAMAQVMNYWQWPVKGTGSHTDNAYSSCSANFGNTTYDWKNMLDRYDTGSPTADQKNAVATLMYHCGVACDMQYSPNGSGAYTIDYNGWWTDQGTMSAETALTKFFGYNSETVVGYYRNGGSDLKTWTKSEWIAMLKGELDAKRPIMYAGTGYEDPNDEDTAYGHSFVCDGYDSNNLFHFNFGWTNWCDGYYDIDALETTDPGSGGGNGNYSLEQDVIVGIMPPGKDVNVTWMADGQQLDKTVATLGILSLTTKTPANCESGKVFVGWTASQNYESESTAPTFVKAGEFLDADATFYAVYANAEGGSASVTTQIVMENIAAASGTNSGFTFEAGGSGTAATYNTGFKDARYYAGNTLTISCTNEMTKIVFKLSAQGLKRLAPITASVGTIATQATGDTEVTWTGSATSVTFTVGAKADYGSDGNSKAGQLDFTSVDITTGGGATYSNYSTACGAAVVCELTGIVLNTDKVQKEFVIGSTFNYNGLVVTANYSNCSSKTVTPKSVSTPDMSAAGKKTVTVTYEENSVSKTATYEITVKEPQKYTISFYNNGELIGEAQQVVEGQQPNIPTVTPCDGYAFGGWLTSILAETTSKPVYVTDFTAKENQNYYAVFTKFQESGSGASNNYKKIDATSDLENGNYLIVANNSGAYNAMSTEWKNTYYLAGKEVNPSEDVISTEDASIIWAITVNEGQITIQNADAGYLYIANSGTYYNIKLGDNKNDNKFTYEIDATKGWLLKSATYTDRLLEYHIAKTRWAYYTSADAPVYLYKQQSGVTSYTTSPNCTPVQIIKHTVTYMSCGEEFATQEYNEGENLVLPDPAPGANAGKAFYGWIAEEQYTGSTAPTLIEAGAPVKANATYYAVFK